jgi:transcriptional regulator with XRE-family HTH domain
MNENSKTLEARAEQLVESHYELMKSLIALRKKKGLSQETVGERMGISQPGVAAFEAMDSNPTLSSVRRYAHAVGARITHQIIDDSVLSVKKKVKAQIR